MRCHPEYGETDTLCKYRKYFVLLNSHWLTDKMNYLIPCNKSLSVCRWLKCISTQNQLRNSWNEAMCVGVQTERAHFNFIDSELVTCIYRVYIQIIRKYCKNISMHRQAALAIRTVDRVDNLSLWESELLATHVAKICVNKLWCGTKRTHTLRKSENGRIVDTLSVHENTADIGHLVTGNVVGVGWS